jgi:hypothetical protein
MDKTRALELKLKSKRPMRGCGTEWFSRILEEKKKRRKTCLEIKKHKIVGRCNRLETLIYQPV